MDTITQYQNAVNAIKSAIAEAERIAQVVSSGASALREWRKAMVSNSQGGFPMEIGLSSQSPTINASEWPTGQQIADVLQRFHKAKQELSNAYTSIPESQRVVVQAPDIFI